MCCLAVSAGGEPEAAAELAGQMALVGKSGVRGDFADGCSYCEEATGVRDADAHEELVGGDTDLGAEAA